MTKDLIVKMTDPEVTPKPLTFKNDAMRKRYQHAKSMAVDAMNLSKIERIEKYSFASLYTGKWGDKSDDSELHELSNMSLLLKSLTPEEMDQPLVKSCQY